MKISKNYECEYCHKVFDNCDDCVAHEKECEIEHAEASITKLQYHKVCCCFSCKYYQVEKGSSSRLICHRDFNLRHIASDYGVCCLFEKDPKLTNWDCPAI